MAVVCVDAVSAQNAAAFRDATVSLQLLHRPPHLEHSGPACSRLQVHEEGAPMWRVRGRRLPTRAQPLDERELLAQQAQTKHWGLALQWRHLPKEEHHSSEQLEAMSAQLTKEYGSGRWAANNTCAAFWLFQEENTKDKIKNEDVNIIPLHSLFLACEKRGDLFSTLYNLEVHTRRKHWHSVHGIHRCTYCTYTSTRKCPELQRGTRAVECLPFYPLHLRSRMGVLATEYRILQWNQPREKCGALRKDYVTGKQFLPIVGPKAIQVQLFEAFQGAPNSWISNVSGISASGFSTVECVAPRTGSTNEEQEVPCPRQSCEEEEMATEEYYRWKPA
ncbi:uncharacterized protein LOC144111965 isoform X1 [Amblyomma americanum]